MSFYPSHLYYSATISYTARGIRTRVNDYESEWSWMGCTLQKFRGKSKVTGPSPEPRARLPLRRLRFHQEIFVVSQDYFDFEARFCPRLVKKDVCSFWFFKRWKYLISQILSQKHLKKLRTKSDFKVALRFYLKLDFVRRLLPSWNHTANFILLFVCISPDLSELELGQKSLRFWRLFSNSVFSGPQIRGGARGFLRSRRPPGRFFRYHSFHGL